MTQKQRERLCDLRAIIQEKGSYNFVLDGDSVSMAFRMAKGYKDIEDVLYSVLTDYPENDYREEDWETGTEAMERLRNINEI